MIRFNEESVGANAGSTGSVDCNGNSVAETTSTAGVTSGESKTTG